MRYVAVREPGGSDVLYIAEASVPEPRSGEVLIRVEAAGVNRPDVQQRRGLYPPPPDASPVLGLEVAGTVERLGPGASQWQLGERVTALVNGGGYAEFCTVPEVQCLPWPTGYDAVRAAALPETFFTVWANLFGHGKLVAGETVLVHGGSSGIGTTAIQLARAFGARVITTSGSSAKCEACERLGAEPIDYRKQDFVAAVAKMTGGIGVNVVLDMVAGQYLSRNMECLARDGRLVVIAVQGGVRDEKFSVLPIMHKRLVVTGSTMRPRSREEKGAIARDLRDRVWPLLDAGKIAPVIDRVFPMTEAAAAHARMESGEHIGKIVLEIA